MKVALILASNIYLSPYIKYYTNLFECENVDFDIICWSRVEEKENYAFKSIKSYNCYTDNMSILGKIINYVRYKKYIEEQLKMQKYDYVIIFTAQLGIILYNTLNKLYKHKYIIDIRDYNSLVKIKPVVNKLLKNSKVNVISSKGYLQWLPAERFLISHNCSRKDLELSNRYLKRKVDFEPQKIKIATIGAIRDFEANIKIINLFKNDSEFELYFIGKGVCENKLKNYCHLHKINNVIFEGYYNKSDELNIYKKYDFVNSYTNNDINGRTLMSNRFYNALITNKPSIFLKNSYMGEIGMKNNLGVIIDENSNIKEEIRLFLKNQFSSVEYNCGRELMINSIKEEIKYFESELLRIIYSR